MSQLAADNFTRANATGIGAAWSTVTAEGTFDIVSNTAACHDKTLDSCMYYNAITWPNDHYSEVKVSAFGSPGVSAAGIGVLMRASAVAQSYYRFFMTGPSGTAQLRKRIAGTGTTLGSAAGSVGAADLIRGNAQSTTISGQKNGAAALVSVTDSALSAGNAGIHYSSTDSNVCSVSNFAGGDYVTVFEPALQRVNRGINRGVNRGI